MTLILKYHTESYAEPFKTLNYFHISQTQIQQQINS